MCARDVVLLLLKLVASACILMRAIAGPGGTLYDAVDMYNSTTGAWSTALLSVARGSVAATSLGNVAIFGGGYGSALLWIEEELLLWC